MMDKFMTPPTAQVDAVRLLRCRTTQRYFSGEGWTENPAHAQPFPDEVEAMRACVTHELQDMELVIRVPTTGTELFTTPIQ